MLYSKIQRNARKKWEAILDKNIVVGGRFPICQKRAKMGNFAQNHVKLDIFGTFLVKKGVNPKYVVAALAGCCARHAR